MNLALTRLGPILADVRAALAARRRAVPLAELRRRATGDPSRRARFVTALRRDAFGLIAELKRRSPSAGALGEGLDLAEQARAYARGGADCLSVLTETAHFGGSLEDLERVAAVGLPRLRKDFVLDESMVLESAVAGAECVLLIAIVLAPKELIELAHCARELGLAVLIEVHEGAELEHAIAARPDLIGVNARDLRTLSVDLARSAALLPKIPREFLRVAESGVRTLADLERLRDAGADAALVGERLMKSSDPAALLASWKAALRG